MHKRLPLLLAMLAFHLCLLSAQDSIPKSTLTLRLGPSHLTRQDLVFSPFIHRELSLLNVGIDYTRQGRMYHRLRLGFTQHSPMLVDPYTYSQHGEPGTAGPHVLNFIQLDYRLGARIHTGRGASWALGGVLTNHIQPMDYVYGRVSNFGYVASLGIGIFGEYDRQIGARGTLSASVQVPAVAWLARSPYLVNDDEYIENQSSHSDLRTLFELIGDGDVATWDKLQQADAEIAFQYGLGRSWAVGAGYGLSFLRAVEPRLLVSWRQSFQFYLIKNL